MTTYPATHCPYCGTELGSRVVDGRDRQHCERCERVVWQNPVPCAGVAVVDPERGVLLAQRGIEPGVGEWTIPGGHMEVEETAEIAGTRELEEETDLAVDPDAVELLDVFNAKPFDGKHVVSIGYVTHADDAIGTPAAGPEVQAVGWFTPSEFAASDRVFHEPHGQRFERAWTHVAED
jgi:ADP-ribose pyrophosphatase YjhB (NUDIX family)